MRALALTICAAAAACTIAPENAAAAAKDRARHLVEKELGGPSHDIGDMRVGLVGDRVIVCGRVVTVGESRPFVASLGSSASVDLVLANLEEKLDGGAASDSCTGDTFEKFLDLAARDPAGMTRLIEG